MTRREQNTACVMAGIVAGAMGFAFTGLVGGIVIGFVALAIAPVAVGGPSD